MTRRLIFPLLMGLLGCAILAGLGGWQLQRLAWKTAILDDIDARILAAPVALSGIAKPDPDADRYLPVTVTGALTGQELHVLTSADGPGYRVIAALDTGDRRIMADLGYIPLDAKSADRTAPRVSITGNLHWPQEVDDWTPEPDADNIWYARDVAPMAAALGADPVLVVARVIDPNPGTIPLPLDSAGVANDHLQYAITWFSLALVWAAMTGFLMLRVIRAAPTPKD